MVALRFQSWGMFLSVRFRLLFRRTTVIPAVILVISSHGWAPLHIEKYEITNGILKSISGSVFQASPIDCPPRVS